METNTNTIPTAVSKWRNLHNWAVGSALLFILAMAGTARAVSVTNVIYYDTFNRVGPLTGTSPDTVNASGATWVGAYPTNGIVTDGTEASITNLQGHLYQAAYLPLNMETGHIYIVTCTIVGNSNAPGALSFGFSIYPALYLGVNANQYWTHYYTDVNCSNNGCSYWPYSGISSRSLSYPWTPSMTYSTVLNLITNTTGTFTNEVGAFYTNGILAFNGPAVAWLPNNRLTANSGTFDGYVFLDQANGNTNAAGSFQNFSVTDIVLNATAPTILEQPNSLTAAVGQTATFWVRAYALPDPTYQWMTNNTPIPGATNASYTTPALSTAYNGMQYSVQLSTVAGNVTSSSATLTVTAGTPTVYSVTKTANPNNVVVNFSEPVDPTTALNAGNYTLLVLGAPSGSVTSVSYGSSSNNVILTTSTLNPNLGYSLAVQNVKDQFGDAMSASTNLVFPAGMVFYLRGDSGVQLDASGNVAQWLDQTTNGNNAQQFFGAYANHNGLFISSPGARPAVGSIGVNSTPAVSFNSGNKNYLTIAPSEQFNLNGDLTLYCYANPASSGAQEVFNEDVGNIAAGFELQLVATSLSPTLLLGDGDGASGGYGTFAAGGATLPVGAHVWAINSQIVGTNPAPTTTSPPLETLTNSVAWFVDGSPYGGLLGSGTNLINCNYPGSSYSEQPIYIGGRADHGAYMNGTIGELMLFSGPIPGADRTNIDNYLGQKYGAPFAISQQPQPVTSSNGFTATFNIVAGQGSTHILYQWQEQPAGASSPTNITGANGSTFTTPLLAPSDNNDTFDVVMTLPNGTTTTSSAATLTVLDQPPYVTSTGMPIWNTNQIVVVFDEAAVDPVTATTVGNYSLNNGGSVLSAAIGDAPNKVVLTTSGITWNANPGYYTLTVQNVQDLYGNTMTTASPGVGLYPPNVALWVSAGTGVVTDPGTNTVNTWYDQSGNGNTLYSYFLAAEPKLTNNSYGYPVVRFIGTNNAAGTPMFAADYNSYAGAPSAPSLEITGDISIFAVVNFATLVGGTNGDFINKNGLASEGQGNKPAPYDFYVNASDAQILYRGNGSSIADVSFTGGEVVGQNEVVGVVQQRTIVSGQFAGKGIGTAILSTTIGDAGNSLLIGSRPDVIGGSNGNRFTGDLSALVLIGAALDNNDMVSLENYLAAQYNVPLGTNTYPAITQQPVAVTNVYQTLTVSVTAAASGTPSVAYQWYVTNNPNSLAVAGETGATLVITNAQTTNAYYLVVTNTFGSAISSNAVVNVIPVNTTPTNVMFSVSGGTNLVLSWPPDHIGWQLQAQTNSLSVGLGTNWVKMPGSSTTNQVFIPMVSTNGSVFLRMIFPPQ